MTSGSPTPRDEEIRARWEPEPPAEKMTGQAREDILWLLSEREAARTALTRISDLHRVDGAGALAINFDAAQRIAREALDSLVSRLGEHQ